MSSVARSGECLRISAQTKKDLLPRPSRRKDCAHGLFYRREVRVEKPNVRVRLLRLVVEKVRSLSHGKVEKIHCVAPDFDAEDRQAERRQRSEVLEERSEHA